LAGAVAVGVDTDGGLKAVLVADTNLLATVADRAVAAAVGAVVVVVTEIGAGAVGIALGIAGTVRFVKASAANSAGGIGIASGGGIDIKFSAIGVDHALFGG